MRRFFPVFFFVVVFVMRILNIGGEKKNVEINYKTSDNFINFTFKYSPSRIEFLLYWTSQFSTFSGVIFCRRQNQEVEKFPWSNLLLLNRCYGSKIFPSIFHVVNENYKISRLLKMSKINNWLKRININ